jgi:hypothetical protein
MSSSDKLDRKIREIMHTTIEEDRLARGRQLHAAGPIVVKQHGGSDRYWRVPVIDTIDGRPAGYFDLREDPRQPGEFTLVRYNLTGSRDAADTAQRRNVTEITADEAVREARKYIGPDAIAGEAPMLEYLGFDTRIAWKVPMVRPDGTRVNVFVTPGAAFVQP